MKDLYVVIMIIILSSYKILYAKSDPQIIPMPQEMTVLGGEFKIDQHTIIKAGRSLIEEAEKLRNYLVPATGYRLAIDNSFQENIIELKLADNLSSLGDEGYTMEVSPKKVLISAYHYKGLFWGIQSLRQLLPNEILREALVVNVDWVIPCIKIVDKPRFKWRGLMIDYSRTFWSVSHTKKYIDVLSYFKMNKLHMHLTDDQGWRLEIEKYPLLTEIASKFDTVFNEPPEREGFYTKEDIREIVKYAKTRNVEIIPEIEMLGHSSEVFSAYPQFSCTGDTLSIHTFFEGPNIHKEIYCAGKEETFEFLEDVLSEVADLFPSEYVHIGADEAPKDMWEKCANCQRVIKDYNLKNEEELQSWFVKRIEKFLNSKGKKLIGWDEIIEGGLSKSAVVMYWRSNKSDAVLDAVKQGNNIILTPTSHCYFDYTYDKISTEKVYSFEPESGNLTEINSDQILGVQANFWSHIDRTEPTMDRQIFPRLLALAEVGWTKASKKNREHFMIRMKDHLKSLKLLGVYYMN